MAVKIQDIRFEEWASQTKFFFILSVKRRM